MKIRAAGNGGMTKGDSEGVEECDDCEGGRGEGSKKEKTVTVIWLQREKGDRRNI